MARRELSRTRVSLSSPSVHRHFQTSPPKKLQILLAGMSLGSVLGGRFRCIFFFCSGIGEREEAFKQVAREGSVFVEIE